MNKYVVFEVQRPRIGLTERVSVIGRISHEYLGMIKWAGAWRKYVFHPKRQTMFDPICLNEISEYMENMTRAHHALKREQRRRKP